MSERYTKLFTLPENLYAEGAPVVVSAGALLKDNQTGKVLAQIKIKNISNSAIKAAKIRIAPFDTVGNPIDEAIEHEYLDLSIQRDGEFGQKTPIALSNASTRAFDVTVSEVIFSDNSIWQVSGNEWKSLSKQVNLENVLNNDRELLKQYRIEYGSNCKYEVADDMDLWHCSCGAVNRNSEANCHRCNCSYEDLKNVTLELLEEKKSIRLADEKQKAQEAEAAAKAKAKKIKKICAIVAPIVVVLIVAGSLISNYVSKSNVYKEALALVESKQYSEAIEILEPLGNFKDSKDMLICAKFVCDMSESFVSASSYEDKDILANNEWTKELYEIYAQYEPYCGTFECVTKGVNDDIIEEKIISDFYYENGEVHWYDTNEDGYYPLINYALYYGGKTIYKTDSTIFSTNNIVNDTTINDVVNKKYYMDGDIVASIKFKDNQIIYTGKCANNKTLTLKYSKTK